MSLSPRAGHTQGSPWGSDGVELSILRQQILDNARIIHDPLGLFGLYIIVEFGSVEQYVASVVIVRAVSVATQVAQIDRKITASEHATYTGALWRLFDATRGELKTFSRSQPQGTLFDFTGV